MVTLSARCSPPVSSVHEWLGTLRETSGHFSAMLRESALGSIDGYGHTIREICQQPATWTETARCLEAFREGISESLKGCERVVLTGSGSSQFAGECVGPALQRDLGLPVDVRGGGSLLVGAGVSVAGEPALLVSLARSGESPESIAAVQKVLDAEPRTKHLILTCNSRGRLARQFAENRQVRVVSLSEEVHDRSLVMTSSFTNLALSARFLGFPERPEAFAELTGRLDLAARRLLTIWPDRLAAFVSGCIDRVVFLGDECRLGAARECALKVLEMTGGKVAAMAETYLGLRHGPMCFINERTLVVCLLSSEPLALAYERDLIAEVDAKALGARKLVTGANDAGADLCKGSDLAIGYESIGDTPDEAGLALLDAMIGQIMGFHLCRETGLQPDCPSEGGIISRVVGEFRIHAPARTDK